MVRTGWTNINTQSHPFILRPLSFKFACTFFPRHVFEHWALNTCKCIVKMFCHFCSNKMYCSIFYHNNLHTNIYIETKAIFGAQIQFHSFSIRFSCFVDVFLLDVYIISDKFCGLEEKWEKNINRIRAMVNMTIIQVICRFYFFFFISFQRWNCIIVFWFNILSLICVPAEPFEFLYFSSCPRFIYA